MASPITNLTAVTDPSAWGVKASLEKNEKSETYVIVTLSFLEKIWFIIVEIFTCFAQTKKIQRVIGENLTSYLGQSGTDKDLLQKILNITVCCRSLLNKDLYETLLKCEQFY